MTITQLQYFLVLAEQQHFSNTAARLGISQPALSKAISSLEKEIGVQLFDRSNNRTQLTAFGKEFLPYARKANAMLKEGIQHTRGTRYDMLGILKIYFHVYPEVLLDCILEYTQLNPGVELQLHHTSRYDNMISSEGDFLIEGADFGKEPDLKGSWESIKLVDEHFVLAAMPEYTGFNENRERVEFTELKDFKWVISINDAPMFEDITFKLGHKFGFTPKMYAFSDDFNSKIYMVGRKMAITLIPQCCMAAARRLAPGIRFYELEGVNTMRSIYLLHKKKSIMTELALDFRDFVMDYYFETLME